MGALGLPTMGERQEHSDGLGHSRAYLPGGPGRVRRILTGSKYPKGSHPEGRAFVKAQEVGRTVITAPTIAAANKNTTAQLIGSTNYGLGSVPRAYCVLSHSILATPCHVKFTHGVTEAQDG